MREPDRTAEARVPSRGDETRARLLSATRRVIAAHGWGGVTTRAVAEEAGVNPGLVHYHFSSVDGLRREAVRACMDELLAGSVERLEGQADTADGVRAVLALLAERDRREPETAVVLFEGFLASLRDEALRADLVALLHGTRAAVAGWISASSGREDAEAVATLLLAALDGIFLHRLIDPTTDPEVVRGPLARLTEAGPPATRTRTDEEQHR